MRQEMRAFDTYTHINELKKAGFNEEQAAVIIKSLVDSRETDISHLATKEQVNAIEKVMATKEDLKTLEVSIHKQISQLHASTLKWVVGTMIALVGVIIAAIKLF